MGQQGSFTIAGGGHACTRLPLPGAGGKDPTGGPLFGGAPLELPFPRWMGMGNHATPALLLLWDCQVDPI
jgi:hypothetical protein